MTAPQDIDGEGAVRILTAVLNQPGGGETVLGQLGSLPGVEYTPPRPGGLMRRAEPGRLVLGDQAFRAPVRVGTQLQVSHFVRGVALQTRVLGPTDAARALVGGLRQLIANSGGDTREAVDAALYGLAGAAGLG